MRSIVSGPYASLIRFVVKNKMVSPGDPVDLDATLGRIEVTLVVKVRSNNGTTRMAA